MKKKEAEKSGYSDLQRDRNLEILKLALNELEEKYNLSYNEILSLIKEPKEIEIPISAFSNDRLSILEIICKYLKEIRKLSYHEIAVLIKRNDRTIWTTYNNSLKRFSDPLSIGKSEIFVPISIFSDRRFSALESLVVFLKEIMKLRYVETARLLRKDQRNIWTVYSRAVKKREKNAK